MKLSIIIPHHNGKKLLFDCLESLFDNISSGSVPFLAIIGNDDAMYSRTLIGNAPFVTSVSLSGPIPNDASSKKLGMFILSTHPLNSILFSNFCSILFSKCSFQTFPACWDWSA